MYCSKCSSNNVTIQVVNEQKLVTKHHGIIWWLCIGWWWIFVKWLCIGWWWIFVKWLFLTIPALIFSIFVGKRKKIKNIQKKVAVCQNCGYTWRI